MKHILIALILCGTTISSADDPLPSWKDGPAKNGIVEFVSRVTTQGGADYVPAAERIAVFDNDGTLWSEQPAYFQLLFAMDRVSALAADHPEWKTEQPFQAVLENDMKALAASGKQGLLKLVAVTHTGMTTEEFAAIVRQWIKTAKHPKTRKPYTQMVYQPMLELLNHLRENGFKTFIVSGGGIEFMRVWAEEIYGIPPEQVIGSSVKTKYEVRSGKPVIVRLAELNFLDDGPGKPVGINQHIGRRPIMAFGNSDGDFEMLEWTTSGKGPRFGALLHHTDAAREWAYDRESHIGKLSRGLDEAPKRGWLLIDMKTDWNRIFPANSN